MKRRNRPRAPLTALLTAAALLATGCGTTSHHASRAFAVPGAPAHEASGGKGGGKAGGKAGKAAPEPRRLTRPLLSLLPGLGPKTLGLVPDDTRQALVVTGEGRDKNRGTAVLYERERPGAAWLPGHRWPADNAVRGWTDKHVQGDLRSPIGLFTLTDAGGLLPDPGTKLTYDAGPAFTATGTGSLGEPLAGSFDYVIAVNYNRRPGATPLDWTRPLGASRGGGIWLHVDHEGPTQGCLSFSRPVMKHLLRTLDPAKNPVVVMGDKASLRR
ncbi:hypothetical protein [Streptomyces sp. ISL-100]|uniref:hypothetical protein n=1 Tax=Streptomyces sp. ISL-100 TaxID=2819173 RepID=UPI001BE575EB|nr:hypothetical protein [Streptomyces sp. ISL-100]MBT2394791.1 hypothetical protein [Streptomyces sp. ISL-100]